MARIGISHFHVGELFLLLIGLGFQPSDCTIQVTVEQVESYSALLRWNLDGHANTTITGFRVTVQTDTKMMEDKMADKDSTTFHLLNLDDMRFYNACVVTLVSPGGVAEASGCVTFKTLVGTSTYLAIVSGVFLVLCLIVFGVLDILVSRKRKHQEANKEEEILQQGWQTFQRNSKKKQKGKKRAAPRRPEPSASIPDETPGWDNPPTDAAV